MKNLGLKDVPIARSDDEALGLTSYAKVLRDFVARCDTPITIALQGDWGSGKTSLMNLIKESLDQEGARYKTVWFNTWQYAQFNSSDTLALSMMSYFIDSLAPSDGNAAKAAAKRVLHVARALAVGGASVIGQADTVKTVITEAQGETADADPSVALKDLKERITKVVQETVNNKVDKVIVFIDDIDRLVPVKAIELLEALKMFLDIDRCVYLIACDYSVVVTGLKEKFGVDEVGLQGKSFFDKIIQVPFKMPVLRYKVESYLKSLLKKIDVEANEDDIEIYQDLIDSSIGFNPRTMKRMFNSLTLLMILAKEEKLRTAGDDRSMSRVLFGVLCMQEHYEHLYDFIRRQALSDRLFKTLADEFDSAEEFEQLRNEMSVGKTVDPGRVKLFMGAFFRCLQLDEDEKTLSSSELKHLRDVLGLSSIVSASVDEFKIDPDKFVLELRRTLNKRYDKYLDKGRPRIGKFRYSRSEDEVFLELPGKLDWCRFTVQIEEGYWGFGLEAEDVDGSLSKVECHFRENLSSVDDVALERERYVAWYWQPVASSSKEDLLEALHPVLGEMLPRLNKLCKSAEWRSPDAA